MSRDLVGGDEGHISASWVTNHQCREKVIFFTCFWDLSFSSAKVLNCAI